MKTTILKLALILFVAGLWIVAGTTTGASDARLAGGAALPEPTPVRRIRANTNVNAANATSNIDWNAANTAANTAVGDDFPDPYTAELPTCTEQPKGPDQAHLYFLNAKDILDAADSSMNDGESGTWTKLRREAVRCLSKAISIDPSNRTYLLKRADVNDDDPLLAIKDVSKVIEAYPDDTDLYIKRAEMYVEAGQLKAALADHNKAISVKPRDTFLYVKRSQLFERQLKDKDKALADLKSALEIDPSDLIALSYRADILAKRNDYTGALKDISMLIEKDPTNSIYHLWRAEVYEASGQISKAFADVNAAIKLSPKSYLSFKQRAKLHRKTGQTALALRDERTAKRLQTQLMKELEKEE